MHAIDFVLMRGGTSKGVFLRAGDVPREREALTAVLLDLFGSPDRRQIDGLGGADKLTSKAAIVGPPIREGTDCTYLFGQVGIAAAEVDYNLNCGNLTAAVGMYAIQEGLVAPVEGVTRVRIHNLNTDRVIDAEVPVRDGEPLVEGDFAVAGVPGTGAPIDLDFARAGGAITGDLLPLGAALATVEAEGLGAVAVSVVDLANLVVFVDPAGIGLTGAEDPAVLDADRGAVAKIDAIRRAVAHKVGLGAYFDSRAAPASPICVLAAPPAAYAAYGTGERVEADAMDLLGRIYANGSTSRAFAGTVAACTGVAARLEGSVVHRALAEQAHARERLRIGHPSGVIAVDSAARGAGAGVEVALARIARTARRLAEGRAYLHPAARAANKAA